MDKQHYYSFTFYEVNGENEAHASSYYGLPEQRVTLRDIALAKQAANVSQESVLLSCCYLGHMPAEEFAG